jgi:hypothetical protein
MLLFSSVVSLDAPMHETPPDRLERGFTLRNPTYTKATMAPSSDRCPCVRSVELAFEHNVVECQIGAVAANSEIAVRS